jgi:hypothetical protein
MRREPGGTPPLKEASMNTTKHRDNDSQRLGTASDAPTTQFIQICASQNDLFALDKEGNIYQYNFNAKAWVKLGTSRSYEEHA